MSVRSIHVHDNADVPNLGGDSLAAQVTDRPIYVQSETLVVAKVKDTNQFLAYSKTVGKWNALTFPERAQGCARRCRRRHMCVLVLKARR